MTTEAKSVYIDWIERTKKEISARMSKLEERMESRSSNVWSDIHNGFDNRLDIHIQDEYHALDSLYNMMHHLENEVPKMKHGSGTYTMDEMSLTIYLG